MNTLLTKTQRWLICLLSVCTTIPVVAQTTDDDELEDVYTLSPFEITTDENVGYLATTSLAGTRLKTDLKDVGSAISVVTAEFLTDTGATDNESLLMYTTSGEVGGLLGNYTGVGNNPKISEDSTFANPSANTRVRGLAAADNTRNYFLTDIPWDGYMVERVDMQRGPNSILFGLGSPAGIINTTLDTANFVDRGKVELRIGQHGTTRGSFNINKVLLEDQLGVRIAGLNEKRKYQQKGAFENDDRIYVALRYEPEFLKKDGMLTSIRFNYEKGNINRNNPRTLPPVDKITPWFTELGKETFNPYETQDNYNMLPGLGARRPTYENGDANPYFNPWVGNFAQVFGGALAIFSNPTQTTQTRYYQTEIRTSGIGLAADGSIDGDINGIPYQRPNGIKGYADYAKDAKLPFYEFGQYKDFHITDPTIFDFYNNLIDGPNKGSNQDWDAWNIVLSQTFLNNKIGLEAVFDKQSYEDGTFAMLSGERYAIYIDIDDSYANGEANPNVGRPFVSDSAQFGNGMFKSERESMRFTAFGDLDFRDFMDETSIITKILGRHVFTTFFNKDSLDKESRSWLRYATDEAYGALIDVSNIDDNARVVNTVTYLGGSLAGMSSASGANIPSVSGRQIPTSGSILRFDPTWNAPDIDLGAPYEITFREDDPSTQSENPSNYVGWVQQPVGIINADNSQEERDYLTNSAKLSKDEIESKAFVWQAYLFNGAIVGTYGYREDTAKAWSYKAPLSDGHSQLNNFMLPDEAQNEVDGNSKSYSAVVHFNKFLPDDMIPFNISGYYNESSNFQPAAGRSDIYGTPLPAPNGKTTDSGIMLSTKDGKYSLKINWYETTVNMASSNAVSSYSWFIGTGVAWGYNWAYNFETDDGPDWRVNYQPWTGQTPEQAAALEQAAVAGWYANQPPQKFLDAWSFQFDGENTTQQSPAGFTATEDTISEGIEIEFVANPTSNWRISMNIAKQEASRSNVGGVTLNEYVAERTNAYNNTDAGDIRIWSGGSTETTLSQWNANFMSNYALVQLLEGTAVPELRKWRANLVTNYSWDDGALKGLNVGGGYRWQDKVVIGYPLISVDGATTYDLDNAYYGPSTSNLDLWVGYGKPITDKIDWRVQLNVRNVGEGDSLIPISTQPDGTVAGVRIAPAQVWSITNTFTF